MTGQTRKLITAAEAYFADLRRVHASGGATGERSYYPALAGLLGAVGGTLKPKVFCVLEPADQGAGHPDCALFTASQVQRGRPRGGQVPERGVVEVKGMGDDAWLTAESNQVTRYWGRYRLVLVTNLRNFVLVGADGTGGPAKLETFRLAKDPDDFWRKVETPRNFARDVGTGLGEYLARALSHRVALAEPKDLAWLLASYPRDGLARIEAAGKISSLLAVRSAMEEALGIRFKGERGERFFRSTLIQTLFYGVFSAWVLWSRQEQMRHGPLFESHYSPQRRFRWREAVWHLRAPGLRALFQQLADPCRLRPLGLVEVLDWTSAALDRVDRAAFFSRFNEGEAVPYFYEPFLEAFDPALRKQLGVWYTPMEVVRYMVARADKALKDDLSFPEGLAAENVYVLDPCCGTGAYLAEVLRRIARNLEAQGVGALAGEAVKTAATERVFGFEIMPAPFVVSHLQVGLTMENLDSPFADDGSERAGVYLTNALAGWEPHTNKPLPFPELEEERDRAERVKRDKPILVILGNPPYNGFAGVAVDEERELSEAYRTTRRVRRPEGQGLNDLYVVSSAWRSDASRKRPAGAWSASSPTTLGLTACPSPGCASATSKRSTRSGSTTCMATASFRSTLQMEGPVRRSLRSKASRRASRSEPASPLPQNLRPAPIVRTAATSCTATSTKPGPSRDGKHCWTASLPTPSMPTTQHLRRTFCWACHSSRLR